MVPIISKQRLNSPVMTTIVMISASLLGACSPIEGRWSPTNYGYNDIRISSTAGLGPVTTSILPLPQAARTGISHPAISPPTTSSGGPTAIRIGSVTPAAPRSVTAPTTVPISKTNFRPNAAIVSRSVGNITMPRLATQNVPVLQKPTLAPTTPTFQAQPASPSLFESIGGNVLELFDFLNIKQYDMSAPAINNQQSNIRGSVDSSAPFGQ